MVVALDGNGIMSDIPVRLRDVAKAAADRINQLEAVLSEIGFRADFGGDKEKLHQYDVVRELARKVLATGL